MLDLFFPHGKFFFFLLLLFSLEKKKTPPHCTALVFLVFGYRTVTVRLPGAPELCWGADGGCQTRGNEEINCGRKEQGKKKKNTSREHCMQSDRNS
eukprot:m.20581 g.20581  ORF g.20581 m.20581 type:complete len:96 (-) comp10584_c0_seq2:83-370(-)